MTNHEFIDLLREFQLDTLYDEGDSSIAHLVIADRLEELGEVRLSEAMKDHAKNAPLVTFGWFTEGNTGLPDVCRIEESRERGAKWSSIYKPK